MQKDAGLELIDQLLKNEQSATTVKKKRGRPPKIKEVSISIVHEKAIVEKLPILGNHENLQYVAWDKFIELGSPKWGYTTASIKQHKPRTPEYYEVLLHYHRCAILYSKLTRTIEWYETTNESKLDSCRKEIAEFCSTNNLTSHDLGEIISICYNAQHNRKLLIKQLNNIAKIVLENRKNVELKKPEKDRQTFHIREIANIPQNIRPSLKFVKINDNSDVNIEDIVNEALAEFTDNPSKRKQHACTEHLFYKGLRKPRNGCSLCTEYWKWNKQQGIKETRNNG
jgi:hypothetical protein